MSYPQKLIQTLIIFGCLAPTLSFAQGGATGGGKGVLCGSNLRILDLYEAEEIFHESLIKKEDLDSTLFQFALPISLYFNGQDPLRAEAYRGEIAKGVHQEFTRRLIDLPLGQKLPLSDDATLPVMLPGCSVVQIALFDDVSDTIQRDLALWNRLDSVNQAALILHEYWYKVARSRSLKTSDDTRRMIGLLMSGQLPEPIMRPVSGKKSLSCAVGGYSGAVPQELFDLEIIDEVKNGQSGVGIYFRRLKNELKLGRTSLFLPNLSMEKIRNSDFSSVQASAKEEVFNRYWTVEMRPAIKNNPNTPTYSFLNLRAWALSEKIPDFSLLSCMESFNE